MLGSGPAQTSELDAALARVAELGTTLSTTEATLGTTKAALAKERNALRRVYQLLLEQHELLRRRIYMASAERIDVTQLELEFKKNAEALAEAGSALADADAADLTASSDSPGEPPPPPPAAKLPRAKPTGRRNLAIEDLPEDRIELLDPEREGTLKPFFRGELPSRLSPGRRRAPRRGARRVQGPRDAGDHDRRQAQGDPGARAARAVDDRPFAGEQVPLRDLVPPADRDVSRGRHQAR